MLDPSAFMLAIDFGLTNIGVAVGQKVTNTASELTTLKAKMVIQLDRSPRTSKNVLTITITSRISIKYGWI